MKYFAISPDNISPGKISACLLGLQKQRVTHLYLRARSLRTEIARLIPLIRRHAIMPIIPRSLYQSAYASACAIHTRSNEQFETGRNPSGLVQTASCHSADAACALLDKEADYVFISPVYRPFSKLGDQRPLIAPDTLRMLAGRYGPRIVLLGGMTPERINELHSMLRADFSVAGISMFFNTGASYEYIQSANIHQ